MSIHVLFPYYSFNDYRTYTDILYIISDIGDLCINVFPIFSVFVSLLRILSILLNSKNICLIGFAVI